MKAQWNLLNFVHTSVVNSILVRFQDTFLLNPLPIPTFFFFFFKFTGLLTLPYPESQLFKVCLPLFRLSGPAFLAGWAIGHMTTRLARGLEAGTCLSLGHICFLSLELETGTHGVY